MSSNCLVVVVDVLSVAVVAVVAEASARAKQTAPFKEKYLDIL